METVLKQESLTQIMYTLLRANSTIKVQIHKSLPSLKFEIEVELQPTDESYETWIQWTTRLESGVIIETL